MIKSFLIFLGGEPGEEKPMLLLLGMGFFMGIFLATYQVGAETLFLNVMGESYLDVAFFSAGGLGIISTVTFVILQKKINFSTLVVSSLFLIVLFMAIMRGAFTFTEYSPAVKGDFELLPFILFIMIGPISAITLLLFWGVFGRMFDLRASKRIIGGIDTGALVATIIAFFSIPLMAEVGIIDETYDLLLVSSISSFGVFFFTVWVIKDFNIDKATKRKVGEEKPKEMNFWELLKDPYMRLLSLFLVFSVGAAVFVEYTYFSATEIMYPEEEELRRFLSFFNGTVMILSFLIQSFVNDIIIGKFGIKVALMTMPLVLILFTIGGIIAGHLYGYEFKDEEGLFLFFFMFTACGMAFTASLRDALESPAFKLFFLPMDIKIRFDVQTRIEGVVSEFATFAAGALLIGLAAIELFDFELIHYSYLVLVIAAVVVWLSGKLFSQYKTTLKKTLEEQKKALKGEGLKNEQNTLHVIENELEKKDAEKIITGLEIIEKLEPIRFESELLELLDVKHPEVRKYVYEKLHEYLVFNHLHVIKTAFETEGNEEVLSVAKQCIDALEVAEAFHLDDASVKKLIRSTEAADRIRGARLLGKMVEDKFLPNLLELLRDINPTVRMTAMTTAGKLRRPEIWPILVENLHLATYANAAMSALTASGESALHTIDTSFYKTGQYKDTMIRIIQLLGRIGGKTGTDLLWKKIDFPDKKIVSEILQSLSYVGFAARDFQAARIKISIEAEIGDIAWNMKALQDIPQEDDLDEMIHEAFREEDQLNYQSIFMLLGMIYDPQNVTLVKENIQDGTTDSITFAVELLDIFIEEELKPKLIPVMDDLKVEERLSKLQNFFPPESFESYQDVLLQVINRDYNRINRYTKALAFFKISRMEAEVSDDLIANLFNPDILLLQTAAYTIYHLDKNAYHQHTSRLKPLIKKELDRSILPPVFRGDHEAYHQKLLLIERVLLLKSVPAFCHIPGELITYMAEVLDEIRVSGGTAIIEEGEPGSAPMYILLDGAVDIYKGDVKTETIERKGLFGHDLVLDSNHFDYTALARETCTLLVLRKEELVNLMSKHLEIMKAYIDILNHEPMEEGVVLPDILLDTALLDSTS